MYDRWYSMILLFHSSSSGTQLISVLLLSVNRLVMATTTTISYMSEEAVETVVSHEGNFYQKQSVCEMSKTSSYPTLIPFRIKVYSCFLKKT